MKKFYYLLTDDAVPSDIQIISGEEEKKLNIYYALQSGERIDIVVSANGRIVTATSVFLKIIKKNEQLFVMIDAPIPASTLSVIAGGKNFLIIYKVENISCAFLSRAVASIKETNSYVIAFPSSIHRLQRRSFYRVAVPKSSMIYIIFDINSKSVRFDASDISEGGISFYAKLKEDFVVGEKYNISILIPGGIVLQVDVIVRNILEIKKSYDKIFKVSAEFRGIDRKYRELIAKYVFVRQKEEILKQKGEGK